jgi:hypothetical protein
MVQNVADETQLFERPATIINNNNKEARQSLAFLKKICRELIELHDWQVLQKEATFTTDGSGSYAMTTIASDYEKPVTATEWDRTNEKKIQIVNAQEWQYLKSGIVTQTGIYRFARVVGGNLIMTPDTSGDDLVFEYISKNYALSSGGTAQATFQADTDTSYFKENLLELGLKYYLKDEYGLPAESDADRYYTAVNHLIAQEKPMPIISPNNTIFHSKYVVNIPDSGAGA